MGLWTPGGGVPVIPLPNPGEGGPVNPGARGEEFPPSLCGLPRLRPAFSTPLTGYPAFQILIDGIRAVRFLGSGSLTPYRRLRAGYHTVSVAGLDGYIYLQKSIPFDAGSVSTLAVILRTGGLELLQISDRCCPPTGRYSNLRVSNLAYYSNPLGCSSGGWPGDLRRRPV